jgi:hypothetical protein
MIYKIIQYLLLFYKLINLTLFASLNSSARFAPLMSLKNRLSLRA